MNWFLRRFYRNRLAGLVDGLHEEQLQHARHAGRVEQYMASIIAVKAQLRALEAPAPKPFRLHFLTRLRSTAAAVDRDRPAKGRFVSKRFIKPAPVRRLEARADA